MATAAIQPLEPRRAPGSSGISRRLLEDRAFLLRAAHLDDAALRRLHRRVVGRTPIERMTLRQRGVELLWRLAKDWPVERPR